MRNSPWYSDEIANDPFDILGFDPFPLGRRREADNWSTPVVPAAGKQREALLQQWQNVQRPYAVHGHRCFRSDPTWKKTYSITALLTTSPKVSRFWV